MARANRQKAVETGGRVLTRFLLIFLPLVALIAGVMTVIHCLDEKAALEATKNDQVESAIMLATTVAGDIQKVVSDLLILSKPDSGGTMAEDFLSWSKKKRIYDQICFIDKKGMEVVRVSFEDGNPRIVSEEELQPRSHANYFEGAFELEAGRVYVSPFDLNIEQGKIEQPLKPVIHFATPAFDSYGRKRGVVVLNYLGADLICNFERRSVNIPGNTMLLNSDGFWIKGPRPEDEWAFMYEGRSERTFGNTYFKAWPVISDADSGRVLTENGLFTFKTVYPFFEARKAVWDTQGIWCGGFRGAGGRRWKIVCHVPRKLLYAGTQDVLFDRLCQLWRGFVMLAVVCWILAAVRTNRRRTEIAAGADITDTRVRPQRVKLRPEDLSEIAGRIKKGISLREGAERPRATVRADICRMSARAREMWFSRFWLRFGVPLVLLVGGVVFFDSWIRHQQRPATEFVSDNPLSGLVGEYIKDEKVRLESIVRDPKASSRERDKAADKLEKLSKEADREG